MTRRKKFFTTLTEAKKYLRDEYKPRPSGGDPRKDRMRVFKFKFPVAGRRYFVGTDVEFDFARFS